MKFGYNAQKPEWTYKSRWLRIDKIASHAGSEWHPDATVIEQD